MPPHSGPSGKISPHIAPHSPELDGGAPENDERLFLDAVGDAVPLGDRGRVPPAGRAPELRPPSPPRRALAISWDGERVRARAPGVTDRQLAALERGDVDPEAALDLHGSRADDARARARRFVRDATRNRHRCISLVVGRGRHSAGGGVLKSVVIETLADLREVVAITTAASRHGGAGALYVLLRRQ